VFQSLANPALQLLRHSHRSERGQTSTEYVAVLVVGVSMAFVLGAFVLIPVLNKVITDLDAYIRTVI
jgi:hypothetical protein